MASFPIRLDNAQLPRGIKSVTGADQYASRVIWIHCDMQSTRNAPVSTSCLQAQALLHPCGQILQILITQRLARKELGSRDIQEWRWNFSIGWHGIIHDVSTPFEETVRIGRFSGDGLFRQSCPTEEHPPFDAIA